MTVDCMACLVALAKGIPEGGTHKGSDGITHATLRATSSRMWLTCTIDLDPDNPGRGRMGRAISVPG